MSKDQIELEKHEGKKRFISFCEAGAVLPLGQVRPQSALCLLRAPGRVKRQLSLLSGSRATLKS